MCMLTFLPEGVKPNPVHLLNGAEFNNDGHGFAIVTREARNPIVRRYLDAEVAVADFVLMREQYSDGPALFHSRWGTAGDYGMGNVHPFRVDRRTVMAHNGVLPQRFQPGKKDPRCDTKLYAQQYMRRLDLSNPKVRNSIADTIGFGNKFVILSTSRRYETSYIVNEAAGSWVDDIHGETWYSNNDYQGWPSKYVVGGKLSESEQYTGEWPTMDGSEYPQGVCVFCKEKDVDVVADVCYTCDLCQGCGYVFWNGGCQCYPTVISKSVQSPGRPMALESGVEY